MNNDEMYDGMTREEYLEHHGIKGMKWGVRKSYYRAKAKRTLKKANKAIKKYNELGGQMTIQKKTATGHVSSVPHKQQTTDSKGRKVDYDNNPFIGGNGRRMSNAELKARVTRLELEKKYLEALPKAAPTKSKLEKFTDSTKPYLDAAETAFKIYGYIEKGMKIANDNSKKK